MSTNIEYELNNWLAKPSNITAGLDLLAQYTGNKKVDSLSSLLPLFLNLKGKPYSLDARNFPGSPGREYIMMDPMFRVRDIPARSVWKCGRQVSKTTTLSALAVVQAATCPYLNMLMVAPLHEQIKKISSDNIKPFIEDSNIYKSLVNPNCIQNVLKREFINHSRMYFSFAFLSTDRIRGISADLLYIDEIQSIDKDFLPIIDQCIAASRWGRVRRYTGTPLSIDNTIEMLWEQSSQAEWVFPCDSCNKWNTPNSANGIERMLGKETIICSHCQKPINPVHPKAHWKHLYPERQSSFTGYHLPQIILPLHYANPSNWQEILWHREHDQPNVFLNECLGESSDVGEKMISQTDIIQTSTLGSNDVTESLKRRSHYRDMVIMGIDWGGYGRSRGAGDLRSKSGKSYTTYAISAVKPDGSIDCLHCGRFYYLTDYAQEIQELIQIANSFKVNYIAHDYGGSGDSREVLLIQAGVPVNKIIPFSYTRGTSKPMVVYVPADDISPRHYYSLDKTRSLRIMAAGIKTKYIRLPSWESCSDITQDLMALIEEKVERHIGHDLQLVVRKPNMTDDFCHALNYTCVANWHIRGQYPNFANAFGISVSKELENAN